MENRFLVGGSETKIRPGNSVTSVEVREVHPMAISEHYQHRKTLKLRVFLSVTGKRNFHLPRPCVERDLLVTCAKDGETIRGGIGADRNGKFLCGRGNLEIVSMTRAGKIS